MAYQSTIGIADFYEIEATPENTPTDSTAILPNGYQFSTQFEADPGQPWTGTGWLMRGTVYDPVHHANVADFVLAAPFYGLLVRVTRTATD
jgi:hypothetical protein